MAKGTLYNKKELIHQLEVVGYCVLENAIDPEALEKIRQEMNEIENACTEPGIDNGNRVIKYDDVRFMIHNLQFEECQTLHSLITDGPGKHILTEATNDNLVCTGATYAHCKPGYPGIPMHTDYDPYGSNVYRPSNPVSVRILHYLDDLNAEKAPLRLLPYSHVSLHKSRMPDIEFKEKVESEIQVVCKAGTAVMFNPKMFHGVGPNNTQDSRRVIALTYRPRWAKPLREVEEHTSENLAKLSKELKPFFENLNS